MDNYAVFKYIEDHDLWEQLSIWLTKEGAENYKRLSSSTYNKSKLAIFKKQ